MRRQITVPLLVRGVVAAALVACPSMSLAQATRDSARSMTSRIPAPGGEVVLASDGDRAAYDRVHYAAVRRVGDVLYLSGVVVGPGSGDSTGAVVFRELVRRAFRRIERSLAAAGASLGDVTMLRTYHVWRSPHGPATKAEQFAIFTAVKDEFMPAPHPAWTAVGVTELLPDRGVIEIEVVAHRSRDHR